MKKEKELDVVKKADSKKKESKKEKMPIPINIVKYKKVKVTFLKQLEIAFMMSELRFKSYNDNVPTHNLRYHSDENGNYIIDDFNVYKSDNHIDVKKVKFVKITTRKDFAEKIDLNAYRFKKKKIKISKPTYKSSLYETVGITIPVEIFKVMLNDEYHSVNPIDAYNTHRLSTIISLCDTPFDIKLMDENKKTLGYVLVSAD